MMEYQITKGVKAKLEGGKVVIEAEYASLVNPLLDDLSAKLQSGELDPIKGTDMDKEILVKAIEALKVLVNK